MSPGRTSAITCVDPGFGGDRPGRALVVARQQHGREAERAQVRDRLGRGRLDPVGEDEEAGDRAVDRRRDDGAPLAFRLRERVGERR